MLEEVRIRGLGVIDDAVLEFGPGLTVLTGETGAGKTMLVGGLALLLGGRADSRLIRAGVSRAMVEGRLLVDAAGPVAARAAAAGAQLDDGALLLSRSVLPGGRSRAHVGGTAVPVSLLGELAGELVVMHGQGDQIGLLRPSQQRPVLDRYAGAPVSNPLSAYASGFGRLRTIEAELHELTAQARARAQEADLLRFGLAEVAAAAPSPDEETAVAAEVERLAHADSLRAAAGAAHEALTGAPGEQPASLAELLAAARRALANAASHDAELGALADRLAEVGYLVADISTDLASYAEAAEVDPARLAAAQERQAVLSGLFRKYGASTAAVLDWSRQAAARLDELEGDDGRVAELSHEREDVRGRLAALAAEISSARAAAATRFAAAVTAELADLAMAAGRVEVELTQRRDPAGLSVGAAQLAFGPDGVDEVELLLSAHTSAPARPLRVAASGGELSRVMLAIEVVLAGADPTSTFVFDEVDAGVGGRAAVEVGRRLARLASTAQVIVVTHLPQVAAFADRHLHVRKNDDGSVVHAGVTALDDAARVRELSRMLAGLEESALAQGHAEELLATAASAKARD